jgi:aspartate/tyrosine/aromatic aminotransferase
MLTETDTRPRGLADLPAVETDSLLQLIALCNADPRPEKIDVGVGVYRDSQGRTPILPVIKDAEKILWETQDSKSYLGMAGDKRYTELLRPIVLGPHAGDDRIAGLHTPGGCGALRLGFELIATANPQARVIVGTPTWPNHPPIIRGVGLQIVEYPYYDREGCSIRFDSMVAALNEARAGDVVLLHACCHNPTGADLNDEQFAEVTRIIAERGLLPFVDIAYQGFARGLDEDAKGLRGLFDVCDEVIAAHSCDKNFSVYRDRVGSLWVKTASAEASTRAMQHVSQRAREMWSMPPDHGAAAVRLVLDTPELAARWPGELAVMRERINSVRERLAKAHPRLAYIGNQFGMFSMLPFSKDQVLQIREKHAIYMADSGRFNVVGMSDTQIDRFISAVVETLEA